MFNLASSSVESSLLPSRIRMQMLTCRFVLSTMFQICLLLSGTVASAQGQWVGDLWLENCDSNIFHNTPVFIDGNNKIKKIIPNLGFQKDFTMLYNNAYSSKSIWHNGALYTITSGTMEKNWIFTKWQDDKWHFLGYYKMDSDETQPEPEPPNWDDDDDVKKYMKHFQYLNAIPCDNDRFIAIFRNNKGMDKSKSKMTPFHRMSISSQQEFTIDKAIDHGQNASYMANLDYFELAYYSSIIMTDRHATLLSEKTGLYWVFSLKDASLVKAGNIFKNETAKMITPEMIAKGGFANSPILCANPERMMGTVLVSAQDERFFATETRDFWKEYNELLLKHYRGMSDDEILDKFYYPLKKEFANKSPHIVWYRIYPETGIVEKLKEPPPGGSHSRDGMNDYWRPTPDGWVHVHSDTDMTLRADVEKQLMNRIADFPPNIQQHILRSLFEIELEKLKRNGIKNFSFITFMSDLKKLLNARIKAYKLKPEAETFFNESFNAVENELKAHEKQMKKEFEEFKNKEVKNSDTK